MAFKADTYKRPLFHREIRPVNLVKTANSETLFQGVEIIPVNEVRFPLVLDKEELIFDFGDHYTGYLNISLDTAYDIFAHIPDSPVNISFTFAEMPLELTESAEDDSRAISVSWLQNGYKTVPFMPYSGNLERRYAFRYLKIKRVDPVRFPVKITDIFIDAVSAVKDEDVTEYSFSDPLIKRIDGMCVKTLRECEQDVFEDGPKRDRRLWIGDLRLQALTDYFTFRNIPLIKRCIYLFAEHLTAQGIVAPCVFPDTPPYVDGWFFADYSLCLILCLNDYLENTGDTSLPDELFGLCDRQIDFIDSVFDRKECKINSEFFIDHPKFSRRVASLGYFAYTLNKMISLAESLSKNTDKYTHLYEETKNAILHYKAKNGLYADENGIFSWQSQIWVALSGILSTEDTAKLLKLTEETDPEIKLSTPFAMHYRIEALISCGEKDKVLEIIRSYWGKMVEAGFDCCPECFELGNDMYTPYFHTVLNSACHAWSCTPSYWLRKYFSEQN